VIDLEMLPPKGNGTVDVTVTVESPGGVGETGVVGEAGEPGEPGELVAEAAEDSCVDDAVVAEPPQLIKPAATTTSRTNIAGTCIFRKRAVSLATVTSPSKAIENNTER